MILDSLKIENFRALEKLDINQLGRVNLIVGKNNVGKTTLLEAIEIYASLGFPLVLDKLLKKHGEKSDSNSLAIQNFFTGRKLFKDKMEFYIGDISARNYVKLKPTYFAYVEDKELPIKRPVPISFEKMNDYEDTDYLLNIESQNERITNSRKNALTQVVDFNSYDENIVLRKSKRNNIHDLKIPYVNIVTGYMKLEEKNSSRDKGTELRILFTKWQNLSPNNEKEVVKALHFIDDSIENLKFREGESEPCPFVYTKDYPEGIALFSMGDGIIRILELFISMVSIKDGFLLIDEFENGLHYSVQTEVWKSLFKLANDLNVQIFATTHSNDCIKGFKEASEETTEPVMLFRLGRSIRNSDKGKVIVTEYDKEKLARATLAELEVR